VEGANSHAEMLKAPTLQFRRLRNFKKKLMEKLRIKGRKIMAGIEMTERDRVFTVSSNRRSGGHQWS